MKFLIILIFLSVIISKRLKGGQDDLYSINLGDVFINNEEVGYIYDDIKVSNFQITNTNNEILKITFKYENPYRNLERVENTPIEPNNTLIQHSETQTRISPTRLKRGLPRKGKPNKSIEELSTPVITLKPPTRRQRNQSTGAPIRFIKNQKNGSRLIEKRESTIQKNLTTKVSQGITELNYLPETPFKREGLTLTSSPFHAHWWGKSRIGSAENQQATLDPSGTKPITTSAFNSYKIGVTVPMKFPLTEEPRSFDDIMRAIEQSKQRANILRYDSFLKVMTKLGKVVKIDDDGDVFELTIPMINSLLEIIENQVYLNILISDEISMKKFSLSFHGELKLSTLLINKIREYESEKECYAGNIERLNSYYNKGDEAKYKKEVERLSDTISIKLSKLVRLEHEIKKHESLAKSTFELLYLIILKVKELTAKLKYLNEIESILSDGTLMENEDNFIKIATNFLNINEKCDDSDKDEKQCLNDAFNFQLKEYRKNIGIDYMLNIENVIVPYFSEQVEYESAYELDFLAKVKEYQSIAGINPNNVEITEEMLEERREMRKEILNPLNKNNFRYFKILLK
jgi:hypothetical protein